ncbi:polyhydroxyalkanoate synthesis repressor PhaR [Methylomagnum sp.]
MEKERIIKKYPNRRLYDTVVSAYITLEDIRRLVKDGVKFRIVDAKTEEDITRSILMQVILEQEEQGKPIFSREVLEQIIRAYGDTMQGFMSSYLEQSLSVFTQQQKLMEEQMAKLMETGPMSVFGDLARQNLKLWQSMQDTFLKGYGMGGPGDGKKD